MTGALLAAGVAATAVLAILTLAGVLWRQLGRHLADFLSDWRGEPARRGVPRRPGVMERLTGMERRLAVVENELTPNGGRSVKDRVEAIANRAGIE